MKINELKDLLTRNNLLVKKKFGQNFLINDAILDKIVATANITKNTNVIEIGPGLGFLTEKMVQCANQVLSYEIDSQMVTYLNQKFKNTSNLTIIEKDVLKANLEEDIQKYFDEKEIIVVANLPYYITTAILTHFFEHHIPLSRMVVMMQREVAMRICGTPSTKDYNSLSVYVQYFTTPHLSFLVGPHNFYPEPNVDSAIVELSFDKQSKLSREEEDFFIDFTKKIFQQRRKTLYNNLISSGYSKDLVLSIYMKRELSPTCRSEELNLNQILELSQDFFLK
jgi:16S rRNA (adenine1518-N6/adenine1519-N6)-dimethyltransferase